MWDSIVSYAQESGTQTYSMSSFWWIIGAIGLWKMFEKAGEPGWTGIIPFYRDYKLCEKVMNDPWYWIRELIIVVPVIGWIGYLYFKYQIGKATAKAYGKAESWAWGYMLLEPVFYCITGFDDSDYYGPFGRGDHRTGEARQAKTVDFDVVREQPKPKAAPKVEPVEKSAENDVEFDFNQDNITE